MVYIPDINYDALDDNCAMLVSGETNQTLSGNMEHHLI